MAETSFASLSPTLLARKGGAKPAMRPQHAALASIPAAQPEPEHLEDLGWNDMGDGANETEVADIVPIAAARPAPVEADEDKFAEFVPEPLPEPPAVRRHQAELAERIVAPLRTPVRRKSAGRAAFTLRLDAARHLKLRLATTIRGVSAQALVTEALDALLAEMPEIDTIAAQVKRH